MQDIRIYNSIMASLFADSLALPVHWIYEQDKIASQHQTVKVLSSPKQNKYHSNKELGEHTHYGDQAVLLLKSVLREHSFSLKTFAIEWKIFFANYAGYYDGATKSTLSNLEKRLPVEQAGSTSHDLGGASRIAGLLTLVNSHSREDLITYARSQTAFTHNNPLVVDTAELLIDLTLAVANQVPVEVAIEHAVSKTSSTEFFTKSLRKAKDVLALTSNEAITKLGQGCSIEGALPASFYLILKFKADLLEALSQNCLAGGDSASRGLFVGMVLGAGKSETWEYSEIEKMKSAEILLKISS